MTLCFGNRVVGFKRHYAARAASTEITRLIQIPLREDVTTENRAVIGKAEYKIEQAQYLYDTNPPVTVLTLQKNRGGAMSETVPVDGLAAAIMRNLAGSTRTT